MDLCETHNNGTEGDEMKAKELSFKDYHNAGFPFVWIQTHEQDRAIRDLTNMIAEDEEVFVWDMVDGIHEARTGADVRTDGEDVTDAKEMIDILVSRDGPTVMFAVNFHFILSERVNPEEFSEIIQKLINSRDELQRKGNCLVVLSPVISIPIELSKLFQTLPFELPDRDTLRETFEEQAKNAGLPCQKPEDLEAVLDSALGLTAYEAENACALCIATRDELDPEIISHLRADMIRQSATLEVGRFDETLDAVKGLDRIKGYILDSLKTDMYKGVLVVGVAGTGKTMLAKAIGNEVKRDTILADVNKIMAAGEALVGQAEAKAEQTTKIIDSQGKCIVLFDEIEKGLSSAYSGFQGDSGAKSGVGSILLRWFSDRQRGKAYVIATCNKISELPPEWKRAGRWDAIFFVDLPDEETRDEILDHFCREHGVEKSAVPNLDGWTGAEIEQMVINAKMLGRSLKEASEFVTPITEVDPEGVRYVREWAFPNGFNKKGRCVLATSIKNGKGSGPSRRIKRNLN